jgi:hypothetical protein
MDIAHTSPVERIARVLAGNDHSANAAGVERSASHAVDETWQAYRRQALSVLKTLREPSQAMAAVGDPAIWERMVLQAITEAEQHDASGVDAKTQTGVPHG